MADRRTNDRRAGCDRREDAAGAAYVGPERRQLKHRRIGIDRRGLLPNVCVYCGKVCGADGGWIQDASGSEPTVECRNGICADCASEKYPPYKTDV